MKDMVETLNSLVASLGYAGEPVITRLPGSGSQRVYYRIATEGRSLIGTVNGDRLENEAFLSFTQQLHKVGLPVPEVLAFDLDRGVYLQTDLGDTTLFHQLERLKAMNAGTGMFPAELIQLYKKVLKRLVMLQSATVRNFDYSASYPRPVFDRQSMMWDLNYFKYYFLKLAKVPFSEQDLEDDFNRLCDFLLEASGGFFMYRDFQSRNIMLVEDAPWFIDYQGGRSGPLQYDVASLLLDGKADIPWAVRDELLQYYLDELAATLPQEARKFPDHYYGFVLIRILQALGAYGFRGYYEGKTHFLKSIPYALANLRHLRAVGLIGFGLPTLMSLIDRLVAEPSLQHPSEAESNAEQAEPAALRVRVTSFSFRKGLPSDPSGNGGGFIFDCRALPNPGRYEAYRSLTGRDAAVISFLENEPAVEEFLDHAIALADSSVRNYLERGFAHLSVSFGCTGGQHRSVYCAGRMAEHLARTFPVDVDLTHSEIPL